MIAIKLENETGATEVAEREEKLNLEQKKLQSETAECLRLFERTGNVSQLKDKHARISRKQ